ncbi:FixH family protein [Consotaella salsifontis]|uniref:Nitrogen fixation protein FixH n=1 Tax=Consotaella salsifontis TaxID=1365950 RepID=A0A1T4SWL4_9HYPH|nr:FixH family protein [Consotaella salsifontis]SKA32557.1 Nitrogen fixation protein FixH [Consotaella salsifontis]
MTKTREFTGTHMAVIMVLFFGVVIAVNFTMAFIATGTWSGLVVENSYVESQLFNEKLAAARRQQALGWTAKFDVHERRVTVDLRDPQGNPPADKARIVMTRPTTDTDDHVLNAALDTDGRLTAETNLGPGLWDATVEAVGREGDSFVTTHRFVISN